MELKLSKLVDNNVTESKVTVSETTFGKDFNEALVHQVVNAYLAGGRAGTHAQKTRSQVRGGGAKPWSQKGSGRARAGTSRSPIWTGGGVTFAKTNRDYREKVNQKMYRGAMKAILSELVRQDRLMVVENITPSKPKTKDLLSKLSTCGITEALIITGTEDINLYLSARNVPKINVLNAKQIDPVSLIKFEKVLLTACAVKQIEEVLG